MYDYSLFMLELWRFWNISRNRQATHLGLEILGS